MNKQEALKMLDAVRPSQRRLVINKAMTQEQGVEIVKKAVMAQPDGELEPILLDRRVLQVCQNRRHPHYPEDASQALRDGRL